MQRNGGRDKSGMFVRQNEFREVVEGQEIGLCGPQYRNFSK